MTLVTRVKNLCMLRERLMSNKLLVHLIKKKVDTLILSQMKSIISDIILEKSTEDQKDEEKKVENTESNDTKSADDDASQLEVEKHEGKFFKFIL